MSKKTIFKIIPTIFSPLSVAFCNSCQVSEDDNVNLMVPFVETHEKKAFAAIVELVNKFNDTLDSKYANHKIRIRNSFDKKNINNKVILELNIKDSRTPSLILSYPSIVSAIHYNNRLVELTDIAKKSNIEKKILDYNNRLGFDNRNEIFSLPVGISSEMLIVNKRLLINYFYSIYDKIKESSEPFLARFKNFKIINIIRSFIPTSADKKNEELINYLSNKILCYDDMFNEFVDLIKKMEINEDNTSILFVKHIENYIFETLFKKAGSDFNNYFLKYNQDFKIDYANIFKINRNEYEEFRETLINFYTALKSKKIDIDVTKKITIEGLQDQLFTFITTRAYKYNLKYFLNHQDDFLILDVPHRKTKEDKKGSFFIQGLFLSAIKSAVGAKNEVINLFLDWMYNQNNRHEQIVDGRPLYLTPIEYLSYQLDYIFPTKNFKNEIKKHNYSNIANDLVLKNIFDNDLIPFSDLIDIKESKFREYIKILVENNLIEKIRRDISPKQAIDEFLVKLEELIK
ncbi:hypothetical protein ACWXVJ_00465 [Mycoplasma sp. 773]